MQIVSILTILASLYLVTRGFRSQGLSLNTTLKMALVWAVIIGLGTFLIGWIAG